MSDSPAAPSLSPVLIALMKGVVERTDDPARWHALTQLVAQVRDYVAVLDLELILDESEGYAYLRQRRVDPGQAELPRLVPRRPLSYPVSLLLVLLRKKLAEFDARSGDARLILGREEIVEAYRVFLPDSSNQARLLDRLDAQLSRVVELGFLRPLRDREDQFEVSRLLKAFVDGQWLGDLETKLGEYRAHAAGDKGESDA